MSLSLPSSISSSAISFLTSSYIDLLSMMMTMMMILINAMMIMMVIGEREREVHLIVVIDVVDADITSTCNLRALFILHFFFFFVSAYTTYYPLIKTQQMDDGLHHHDHYYHHHHDHQSHATYQALIASGHVFDHFNSI